MDWDAVRAIDSGDLEEILRDYTTNGTVDPPDLVALLHHYSGYLSDTQARNEVIGENGAQAETDITPYVDEAFQFLAQEEAAYVVPKDPSNGYLIRALEDLERRSGEDILIFFAGAEDSLLTMAEHWVLGSARHTHIRRGSEHRVQTASERGAR